VVLYICMRLGVYGVVYYMCVSLWVDSTRIKEEEGEGYIMAYGTSNVDNATFKK
jgi:hypothetical protein